MRKQVLLLCIVFSLALGLSACHNMPKQAKYIPKDATGVLSVDVLAMGKKMAWSAITGSKIFDEWNARPQQKDAVKGLDNAGIDYLNTMYLYTQKDDRFENGQKVVALIPLGDAAQLETFIKKNFPGISVKDQGKRKEAMFEGNVYAGWDKDLLILIYAAPAQQPMLAFDEDSSSANMAKNTTIDAGIVAAEMEKAFSIPKDNMLVENKHFDALQREGHDISLWMNYDAIMSDYMSKGAGSATGLSFSNSLWQDAAFTAGFDFNKGSIKSDMKYYMPAELQDIGREMGSGTVDNELVEKLPADKLDIISSIHLSPKGIKSIMEKTGVLGLANVALSSQNLSIDDILNAFTGDMGFAMNNFNVAVQSVTSDYSSGDYSAHTDYTTKADYVFVMKINKKENFNKLLQLAISSEALQSSGNNVYTMKNSVSGSPVLVTNDKYAVVANTATIGQAYLNATANSQKLPALASASVTGHPMGFYMDVKEMTKAIDPAAISMGADSAMVSEAKKMIENTAMSGGEFKNNAFQWTMSLNFTDKDENSLLQMLNFAIHAGDSKTKNGGLSAYNGKMY